MKKQYLAFTLILALITSNIFSATFTVNNTAGNPIWWPANGQPGSLQRALFDANTNPGPDVIEFDLPGGSTIVTAGGASMGSQVALIMNDVTINGISTQPGGGSIILNFPLDVDGNNNDISGLIFTTNAHSLVISGSNNNVSNCNFSTGGTQQNSIWVDGGTSNNINGCTFTSPSGHAISIANGGSHTIDDCTVTGSTDVGIIARGTGNNQIQNCSTSAGNHNGIGLLCPNNTVNNCTSFNNARAGIAVDNSSPAAGNTISNNTVYGNNTNFWMGGGGPTPEQGAIFSDADNTTITGNYVYDNAANGIIVFEASVGANGSTISDNVVGRDAVGTELGNGWNGIFVWKANDVTSNANIVVNNGSGSSHSIYTMYDRISGVRYQDVTSGTISNNYIGTDAAKTAAGNDFDGITLHTDVSNVNIFGNTIGYNGLNSVYGIKGGGIALRERCNNNTIQSNYIGMHQDQTDAGNNDYGLSIEIGFGNLVGGNATNEGNFIGYSKNNGTAAGDHGTGVWLVLTGNTTNELYNNNISFNAKTGVLIERGANSNIVGSLTAGNTINSNQNGICVQENGISPANLNSLRGNSFSCNTFEGITLQDNGNNLYGGIGTSKVVTTNANEPRATFVSGTAPANAAVDIYTQDIVCPINNCEDTVSQGQTYITTVSADGAGAWEFDFSTIPGTTLTQANVIVMATDTAAGPGAQNSSEFSVCAQVCSAPQNVAINAPEVCAGATGTLTASASNLSPIGSYQYYWYLGSVSLANEITPRNAINDNDITVTTAGNYIVVIEETSDPANCTSQSAPTEFIVNTLPVVTVTNPATICADEEATFTASSDSTVVSYTWSDQGTGTADTTVGSSTGDYTVTVIDDNGCEGNGTGSLTVNPLPTINFTAPNPAFCTGGSTQVDAGTDPGMTIVWDPVQTPGGKQITVTSGGTYGITVTNPSTGCDDTSSVFVTENTPPTVTIENGRLCQGDSHTFDAGNAGSIFAWQPNGETTQTIEASTQGTYTVVVTDPVTNCSSAPTSVFADENPDQNPEVNLGLDDSICYLKGETVTITATVRGGLGGTLEWSNGTFNDTSVIFSDTVTVWAMYTDTFNCVAADTLKIHNYCEPPIVDVPNVFIPGGTDNPIFTPIGTLTPDDVLDGHLEIYDRWGLKMFETDDRIPKWDGTYNGRVVSSGVYFWIWVYKDVTETDYKLNGFVEVLNKK